MKSNKLIIIFVLIILSLCLIFYYYDNNDKNKKESETKISDVVMTLKKGSLTKEGATFIITNNTDNIYSYGAAYHIEEYKNNKWSKVKLEQELSWNMIAYVLKPRSEAEININWSYGYGSLKKGKYRLVKIFTKDDEEVKQSTNNDSYNIYAEFEIK